MYKDKKLIDIIALTKIAKDYYDEKISIVAKKYGLTTPEAYVLLFFYNNPQCFNAIDLVHTRGISKAYVSKAIALLLKKNYIEISLDENDKRFQKIIISNNAIDIINRLETTQQDFFKYFLKDIESNDLEVFFGVLKQIESNIFYLKEGRKC